MERKVLGTSFSSPTQAAGMEGAFQVYKIVHQLTSACNQDIVNLTIKLMSSHKTRFGEQKRQMDTLKNSSYKEAWTLRGNDLKIEQCK